MALKGILRAPNTNGNSKRRDRMNGQRKPRKPIFELQPLEQRLFLTVSAPTNLLASLPVPIFPPHAASVHPMTQVKLSWSESGSETPTSFNILESKDGGYTYSQVAQIGGGLGAFNYTVTNLTPGTVYFFEVQAAGSGQGDTATSGPVSIMTSNQEEEYWSDFEDSDTTGWAGGGVSQMPSDAGPAGWLANNHYLAKFKNQSVSLTLQNVPYHTQVSLYADLFILNAWQSGATISTTVNGVAAPTFNASNPATLGQTVEVDDDNANACPTGNVADGQYPLGFTVEQTSQSGSNLTITFTGAGISDWTQSQLGPELNGSDVARWGLDNVAVYLNAPIAPYPQCTCGSGGPENTNPNAASDQGPSDTFPPDPGGPGASSTTGPQDVNAATGAVTINTTDLSSSNLDGFSQTRNWTTNTLFNTSGSVGPRTVTPQQPFLSQEGTGTLILTEAGNDSLWFDGSDGGGWVERFGGYESLQHISSGTYANEYLLIDSLGDRSYFNDFSTNWATVLQGKLASTIDANGNPTTYTYNGATRQLTSVSRTYNGSTETFSYTYNGNGQLTNVSLSRAGYGVVRQAAESYWDGTTGGGNAGDLQKVVLEDGSGNALDTRFYRYYSLMNGADAGGGTGDAVQYFFGPQSYVRALANNVDPATDNNDADLQRYADEYLTYNTRTNDVNDGANWGKVKSEELLGQGTYTFTYGSSTSAPGFDNWATKGTEIFPDGSTSLVYSNYAGQPVFKLFTDATTGLKYPTFYKYDSSGRLLWTAHPSAFVPINGAYYSESYPDLVDDGGGSNSYLSQSAGLIVGTDYYSSTTATSTTPGGAAGYFQDSYARNGEAGSKTIQEQKDYVAQTASSANGGATVYEVADDTVFGTAGGDARVTRDIYNFLPGTTRIASQMTVQPPITVAQNGPGAVTGTATGGTTTTLTDTSRTEAAGYFLGDVLTITGGPVDVGQSAVVTAYDASAKTFTFWPAMSSALGSGSTYSLAPTDITVDSFDPYGRLLFSRAGRAGDGDGKTTLTQYDPATGGVVKSVTDASPYASYVTADGPIAYWRLGEASGTTANDLLGLSTGTYSTSGVTLGASGALTNDPATSASFNGSGYVSVPNSASLQLPNAWSEEAWVEQTGSTGTFQTILAKGSGSIRNYALDTDSSGRLRLYMTRGANNFIGFSGNTILSPSVWYLVDGTFDGTTMRLYVNGVLDSSLTTPGASDTSSDILGIGCLGSSLTYNWKGSIEEAAVYGYALSPAQIQLHYSAGEGTISQQTHLNLTTTDQLDGLGRTTKETDPDGDIIYTVFKDTSHETRVYPGWQSATNTTTGPIQVTREYRPGSGSLGTLYEETLTSSATPTTSGGVPTGLETIDQTNIQSLTRDLTNSSGQVYETDAYFSLAGVTYSQSTAQLGSSSNNSASGNYHATQYAYDAEGREVRVKQPTGTIYRTVLDGLGRAVSKWEGTTDTVINTNLPWSPTNNAGNITDVEDDAYDNGNAAGAPTLSYAAGGTILDTVYYVRVTSVSSGVESPGSAEKVLEAPDNNLLVVTPPAGLTQYNVYVSKTPGAETLQNSSPLSVSTNPTWTEPTGGLVSGALINLSGMGDGNLTQVTLHPGGLDANRVTQMLYDFRDRLVGKKQGVQPTEDTNTHRPIFYYTLDNTGATTGVYQYDGDQINLSDFANGLGSLPTADAQRLRVETLSNMDDQGRVYETQTYSVDRSSGAASNPLNSFTWYDHRGNTIASLSVGGLVNKYLYDGAGRQTVAYTTDGRGDSAPGTSTSWANAGSVSGDIVLSQVETQYDANSNPIFVTDRERMHDDPSTNLGVLGTPTTGNPARVYYSGKYYDAADRVTDSVDFGTNQGTVMTSRPAIGSIPSWALHTIYGFDSGGRQNSVTDPRGIATITTYDLLSRVTQTDAGHTTGGAPAASIDQTTTYTYDGENHTLTMTAQVPGGTNQTTGYLYGPTVPGGYQLHSNDLLYKLELPDPSTGNASGAAANSQTFYYDNLGDKYYDYLDSNGSQQTFIYDVVGRLIQDNLNLAGSGVDSTVRSLVYGFDTNGQLSTAGSYSGAGGQGTLLNQVEEKYNGYGQLVGEWQSHSGAVNTSNPPQVQYNYTYGTNANTGQSYSRLTSMVYPNTRQLDFVYTGNSGVDANISRVSGLSDDSGTGAGNIESYTYLGLDTIVQRNRPNGVNLTLARLNSGEGTGDGGDEYIGLDRFGRVVDQRWTTAGGTAADRFQYGYDQDSNVLYKNNLVFSLASELYHPNGTGNGLGYDALNRITSFTRGTLTASAGTLDTVTVANQDTNLSQHTETWNLDAVGNWTGSSAIVTDGTAQSRTIDARNRYTAVGGATPTWDNNGNLTQDETSLKYVYDVWNRIVKVENSSSSVLETYTYDAFGRRITETPTGQTTKDLYFNSNGNVIEEQQAGTTTNQYVWGLGYQNDLVLRDDNSTSGNYGKTGSGLGRRAFVQQDANWNVTSLVDATGNVQERFVYDPYGRVQVVDKTTWNASTDQYNWIYHFQGGRQDPVSGLVHFGAPGRDYSTTLGRWVQQDPAGYVDGANLYQFLTSAPVSLTDPTGLAPQCSCIAAFLDFSPRTWAQSAVGTQIHVGFDILGTWLFAGPPSGIQFGDDETGALTFSSLQGDYRTNPAWQGTINVAGRHNDARTSPGFTIPLEAFGGIGVAFLDDPLGTTFTPLNGSFHMQLVNYTVQIRCKGRNDDHWIKSPKYKIVGGVNVRTQKGNTTARLTHNQWKAEEIEPPTF